MDNQYGLKAVEKQNEITEQALEPKRQFETQLDTPLTMGEYNAIADIYQNSDDKERDILKFGQALEYKRNYGLDLDYAYNNIDALNEARGIPQEYNWSTLQSIKNSFKISALNDKLSDLNSAWMDADYAGQDKAEIEKQIADVESQIEGLQDYAPRSLVTNMMKWAAESSVFTLTTIRDSLTWGAGAGLALAGLAGLAGVPITAGMTLTGLAWASLAGAVGTAATVGGTVSVANKTQGTMYRELRNQGVEKNLARSAASINGYVNGYIETALGVVPAGVGAVLKATGVEKLTATTMARLAMRGTWGTLGKMLANHVVDSIGEGEEEFFQSLADDITDAVVLTISDECKANGVKFDKSVGDVIRDAIKAGGQGFGAALIMGVPTTAVNANVSVKEARRLKAEAKLNPSEADFVKHHENDSAFEGLEKKEVKDMLHQMYKAQNEVPVEERIDQTTIDSDIIEENVDIESEEDEEAVASEVPEKDIERMENGRLRTQEEKDYDVDLEGNEKHTLKVGTPNSSTRYGRVEYTINKDGTIEIDKVSTKAGFQKSVTKDAVLELMRRYAGQDVTWNPTNAYQQKIKAELENENGGKLQRFASEYNQSEEAELGDFLHEKYGQFTPTQGKLLYGLYNNIAQHYGQTVHEMIADAKANNPRAALRFRYMSDAVKEGLIDKKQARRRGLIDYANRVIYVGENGDITTLFHEGFHMLSKVDKEGAQELVKAIAESKDMESYFKSHRAFFVPQLGLTVDEIMQELSNLSEDSDKWTENQDEILTSMFEAYLRDGKTFSKKLENIFSRIADFFIQIYRTLAGGNHLNDNIIKAFDKILEGNPELKEKYEQTEGVRAQNEPTPEERAEADRQYNEVVAKYKGTSEWLKAPNGQPTQLTERQWVQVRTPAFKAWFGDWENDPQNASKVVDENGEPLVVYHGTKRSPNKWNSETEEFEKKTKKELKEVPFDEFEMYAEGAFFTDEKKLARRYSNRDRGSYLPYVFECFLNIKNPEQINAGRENATLNPDGTGWIGADNILYRRSLSNGREATRERAIESGYDGFILANHSWGDKLEDFKQYIVFSPTQIKSATDNVGTFSQSNPSILFQSIGEEGATALDKAEESTYRMDNLALARELEAEHKSAKTIRFITGWERGKDKKWRYEIDDFKKVDPFGNIAWLSRHPNVARYLELNRKANAYVLGLSKENLTEAEQKEVDKLKNDAEVMAFSSSQSMANPDSLTLEDYIDAPELFKAYPQLRDVPVVAKKMQYTAKGAFVNAIDITDFDNDAIGRIEINKDLFDRAKQNNQEAIRKLRSTLIHEIQHAIQSIEEFARGGSVEGKFFEFFTEFRDKAREAVDKAYEILDIDNKIQELPEWKALGTVEYYDERYDELSAELEKSEEYKKLSKELKDKSEAFHKEYYYIDPFKLIESDRNRTLYDYIENTFNDKNVAFKMYQRLAGEVESRNAQARMNMTPEQRRATLLSETEDVAREDQIVLMDGLESQMALEQNALLNQTDTEYLDAVNSNDMAKAQTMVDARAREQGYTIKAYHGTNNYEETKTWNNERKEWDTKYAPITVFKRRVDGYRNKGHFFASDIDNAGGYGSKLYNVYLRLENPLVIDCNNSLYSEITYKGKTKDTYEWAEWAELRGFDGVIFKNIRDGVDYGALQTSLDEYVAFRANQIKSADPVTYDDNGNVIPLSQRFNDSHSSLLFQSAYHGSPYEFEQFDTEHIGEGQGTQSFGWGIYLTQSESIANDYAEGIDKKNYQYIYKGEPVIPSMADGKSYAANMLSGNNNSIATARKFLKQKIAAVERTLKTETDEEYKNVLVNNRKLFNDALIYLSSKNDWVMKPSRNMYTVTIPDTVDETKDRDVYIIWDAPVGSKMSKVVSDALYDKLIAENPETYNTDALKQTLREEIDNEFNTAPYPDGQKLYRSVQRYLGGSQEAASKFLNQWYVGNDYPAGSIWGGGNGKRNFVIFNADDIKIKNHLRFQNELTDDERAQLVAEAREFDTFDDFLNYLSIMNGWVDPAQYSDALPVLDEIYSEAHGVTREKAKLDIDLSGLTDDEKDRTFEEYIDGDGIKNIMKILHDMYTTYYGYVYAHGGLEDDEIEDAESLRARIREFEDNASMFIVNLAKSKKELSDKQFNSIRNVIKKNTRMYRELIADTLESETLRSDAEPDIKGTRGEERPTLADRSELEKDAGTSLDDKVEGEIEKKLDQLDKELSDDEKAAEALTRELDSLMGELKGELTPEEQKALKELKYLDRLAHRKDEYAKALKKKIDNGEAISQAENTRLETVAKKIKELEQALAKFNDKQKAKNYIDKQNALKELKAEIREKQKQRRALKEMHEYKHKLVSYLQRKVPKSVAYEYKGMIEAIISMFSDVSGYDNNITYRGKSLTPKEFREAVDKDGALDELSKYQLKRYNGKSLADYTVEELERFADVKKRLVNVGRQMWQAKVDARNAEAAQIRQIILNHLRKNPKYTTAPLPDTKEDKDQKKSFRKKFSEIFTRTIPMSRITQMLDGGEKGFIYDLLTRDKRLVQDMERLAVRERINRVQELMDKLGVKKEDFYKPVEMSIRQSDDLGPASEIEKYTDTYTLGQLIYGILAQRNVRNANAFMFGDLVTQDEKAILNHNNDLIYDLGMKRNERFVKQAEEILKEYPNIMQVADAIVKDWQDINNKTRLNQVMIDEYNQGLDMEDFYMPIKRLDFNGTSLAQSIADDVYNQNAGKGMTTPKKGITYARKDILPDHQKRTNMDFLELWLNSVDEHEHLIATNAYVRKLNRVFKGRGSEDLRSAIENIYGQHITEDIDNYINDFANPPRATEDRNVSKWIRFMRGRLYEAYLGFKLSSFVLQVITSPAPFLREVNALQLSDYILKVMANPSKYWKFITERSTMMESRSIDPILAEIKKEKNDFTANQFVRTYHKALAFGTGLLEVADRWMVSAGWLACYEKAMAERQEAINNGDMTQMQAELEASQYADEVVLETQPTGDRSELSPIFKTGSAAWQALTQFTTSLNVIWTNLLYDARTDLQNRDFKRAIMTAFAYALAGTVLYAVQDYEPPEDDENWIKDTILKLIYGMTSQGVSSVPLIGSGLEKLSKQLFTGEKQMMSQRVFPMFETARESLERIAQGKLDEKTVRKAIEAISLGLGLPVSGAKELEHIFRDRSGNWRYKGKRLSDNELLDFILKEKWQSVLGRRDNYGNKQHRK